MRLMPPTMRWACEPIVIYAGTFWPVGWLIHDYPTRIFDLAVPPMVVLLVVIVGWRYLTRLFGSNDSFSDLLLATFILALGASLVSAFYLAIRVGTFWSNLGEKGGAVMLIGIFTSALFSFLALPPAFVLPRVLDPALRLRVFRSPQ